MNDDVCVCRVYRGSKAPRRRTSASARSACRVLWGHQPRGRGLRYVAMMLAQLRDPTRDTGTPRARVFRARVTARAMKIPSDARYAAR